MNKMEFGSWLQDRRNECDDLDQLRELNAIQNWLDTDDEETFYYTISTMTAILFNKSPQLKNILEGEYVDVFQYDDDGWPIYYIHYSEDDIMYQWWGEDEVKGWLMEGGTRNPEELVSLILSS